MADHSYKRRVNCLKSLRKIGYQTGSGVMFGLPGQTLEHMVHDLLFFREMDLDMIGMGPYIPHPDTPLTRENPEFFIPNEKLLTLSLKMIACTRLLLKDVNIAATTALHTLREDGREMGLKAGANVIMPNATLPRYKNSYQLYRGKSALNDGPDAALTLLAESIEKIGEKILWNEWGDSPHFAARKKEN
jgi:biotin synthase